MAPSIVVGTNSFVTEAESRTILEEFVHAGAWEFSLNRVSSLITAFYDITTLTLTDPDTGVEINAASAPTPVKQAQSLLAFDLSQKPGLVSESGHGGTNISSVGAGSAKVSFFRPETKGRFPTLVRRLLQPYLGSAAASISGSLASGTGAASSFDCPPETLSEGFK